MMESHSTHRPFSHDIEVSAEEHRRSLENRQRLREIRIKRLRAKVHSWSPWQTPIRLRLSLSCNNESCKGVPFNRYPITYSNEICSLLDGKILSYCMDRHWGPWSEALSPVLANRRTRVLWLPSMLSLSGAKNEGVNRGQGWNISLLRLPSKNRPCTRGDHRAYYLRWLVKAKTIAVCIIGSPPYKKLQGGLAVDVEYLYSRCSYNLSYSALDGIF